MSKNINLFTGGSPSGPVRKPDHEKEAYILAAEAVSVYERRSRIAAVRRAAMHPRRPEIMRLITDLAYLARSGFGVTAAEMKRCARPLHLVLSEELRADEYAVMVRVATEGAGLIPVGGAAGAAGVYTPTAHEGRRGEPVVIRAGASWLTDPEGLAQRTARRMALQAKAAWGKPRKAAA